MEQPDPTTSSFRQEQAAYLAEAEAIIAAAEERGVQLRLLGAIAVIKHCPEFIWLHEATKRELTDIDYMAYSKQQKSIRDLLTGMGYAIKGGGGGGVTLEVWSGREIYVDPEGGRHNVDVFYDRLDFCHPIEFKDRLHLDSPTIPLSDLFLEKLQIVEINEKDLKDLVVLLLEHDVGDGNEPGRFDLPYLVGILAGDWGFYYTVSLNLDRIRRYADTIADLSPEQRALVGSRIDAIWGRVEAAPKSLRWKLRARVGPSRRWYNEVGEGYRELGREGGAWER